MTKNLSPSEAVFAFAAWLTCRDKEITIGATHDASPVVELVSAFCSSQGLVFPRNNYHKAIKPYPEI